MTTTKNSLNNIGKDKAIYFILYVVLWSAQALLIKSSLGEDGKYPYNVVAVTMAGEFVKAIVSSLMLYFDDENVLVMLRMTFTKTGLLYAIPACIYIVFNILQFVNLQYYDPATYRVLINVKVLFSGLLLQYFFAIKLTRKQWIALVILGIGCCVEQLGSFDASTGIVALIFISIQGLMSSMGGVYFQWLIQCHGEKTNGITFWQKNLWLYIWGVLLNGVYISMAYTSMIQNMNSLRENIVIDKKLICIILNGAAGGLSTSFLLRHLDVIVKEYANFVEMVCIAILQYLIFETPIRLTLLLSIAMVSYSVYLYKASSDEKEEQQDNNTNNNTPTKDKSLSSLSNKTADDDSLSDDDEDIEKQYNVVSPLIEKMKNGSTAGNNDELLRRSTASPN